MDNEKSITIQGKIINYENFSDEKVIQLYKELKNREVILYEKIINGLKASNLL